MTTQRPRYVPPPMPVVRAVPTRQPQPARAGRGRQLSGWIIFGTVFTLMAIWLITVISRRDDPVAVAPTGAKPVKSTAATTPILSPLHHPGWMGFLATDQCNLGLIAMEPTHPETISFKALFATDFVPLVLVIDNSAGAETVSIDTEGCIFLRTDGSAIAAPSQRAILQNANSKQRDALTKALASPQTIDAGQLADGRMIFAPAHIDLSEIASVTIKLNGQPVEIPGRLFTAAEKAQRLKNNRP